ncbi:MAG TPA: hypothetical protein VN703_08880, partial [Candidatus Sulfopaludibacter sp.]|nr:hypothetical protein [Candidatus Sulfopaludibacter sp.]
PFEEFFTNEEEINMETFRNIGVIKNDLKIEEEKLKYFEDTICGMNKIGRWEKLQIVELFNNMIQNFSHKEKGKYLDSKM